MSRAAVLLACALPLDLLPSAAVARVEDANSRARGVCAKFEATGLLRRAPGCSGWATRAGRRVQMSYNAHGLRDKDYPPRAPKGTVRVLLVGSAIAAGSGLEEPDSPARALEKILRGERKRVEVINGAGEAFTGWQNAVVLPDYLAAYSPDVVVYHLMGQYVPTDLAVRPNLRVEDGRIVGRRWPLAPSLWRRSPKFARFLSLYLSELAQRVRDSRRLAREPDAGRRLQAILAPTLLELDRMNADCRTAGARLLVVYDGMPVDSDQYPLGTEYFWLARLADRFLIAPYRFEDADVEAALRAAAGPSGWRLVSLAGAIPALSDPANRLPGDYHWNASGARIFSGAVARALSPELAKTARARGGRR